MAKVKVCKVQFKSALGERCPETKKEKIRRRMKVQPQLSTYERPKNDAIDVGSITDKSPSHSRSAVSWHSSF